MAHVPKPRRTAPFSMPPAPRASKTGGGMVKKGVVPKISKPSSRRGGKPSRLSSGRLSILKYEPSWEEVYQNIYDREAEIDRHTNEFSGDK